MTQGRATLKTSTHVSTPTPLADALEQFALATDELPLTVRLPIDSTAAASCSPFLSRDLECMRLHITRDERTLLVRLLRRTIDEVRYELSATQTDEVRALIKPRAVLLTGLLQRVETGNDAAQSASI